MGGGIIILFSVEALPPRRAAARLSGFTNGFQFLPQIGVDGRVTCFTGKIEMGQGVVTSLAQMLADELDVPLDAVDMIMGNTDLCPWDMGTFGSRTTRFFGPPLREAAAEARAVLIQLASEHLHLSESQLTAKDGAVVDKDNTPEPGHLRRTRKGEVDRKTSDEEAFAKERFRVFDRREARPSKRCAGKGNRKGQICR